MVAQSSGEADFKMIEDLPVLEDYDVLSNFDALSYLPASQAAGARKLSRGSRREHRNKTGPCPDAFSNSVPRY